MLPEGVRWTIEAQSGVIARPQALDGGLGDHDIRRLVRRREWSQVHRGVYVDHTGPLIWLQRAWAAVLFAWPAALCHDSALRATEGPGRRNRRDDDAVHIGVERNRGIRPPVGVVAHRLGDFRSKVVTGVSPPRVRLEHAALDVAAEAGDDRAAVAVLADLVQARRTTAHRLLDTLDSRSRIARRALLVGILTDIAEGTCSVLEHDYLTLVERAHGLPRARRQVRDSLRGPLYRDVIYEDFGLVVELDGRLFHDSVVARDLDLDRDLDAVVDGHLSVRIGWGQAHNRPCATAARLGILLSQRGWTDTITPCPRCPRSQQDGGDPQSSGD